MAEIEHVKRARVGRPNRLTSSATKREKSENNAKCNRSRINIGEEFGPVADLGGGALGASAPPAESMVKKS